MIRLDLNREPVWLDLAHGVRVLVAPLTTALISSARADDRLTALGPDASNEARGIAIAKAIGERAILDWEGVGDANGEPMPVTGAAVDALIDLYPIYEAFQLGYVAKGFLLVTEKTSERPRRMALRRGRWLLRGLRRLVGVKAGQVKVWDKDVNDN